MKHRKRVESWSAQKAAADKKEEKRLEEKKKIIFKRAEQYVKEYRDQVSHTFNLFGSITMISGARSETSVTCCSFRERFLRSSGAEISLRHSY